MSEISNKTLVSLLVVAIVVSLGGTFLTLDKIGQTNLIIGEATTSSEGTTSFNVSTVTELTLQTTTIDWGSGYINGTASNCTLDSEGTVDSGCVGFSAQNTGFLIENTGNQNLSVQVNSSADASSFIGGDNPAFQYKVEPNSVAGQSGESSTQDTVASCSDSWTPSSYTSVGTTAEYICGSSTAFPMSPAAEEDAAVMDLKISIPDNAPAESNSAAITFIGTSQA